MESPSPVQPKLAYVVTEDFAFLQHRLPMARAAKAAGFDVHVLARMGDRHGDIEREGFTAHHLTWKRGAASPAATLAAIAEVRRALQRLEPEVVHNVALKAAVVGSMAASGLAINGVVNSVNGLGSAYLARTLKGLVIRTGLRSTLALLFNRRNAATIVQNPDDRAVLEAIGVRADKIVLIPGSGVDTDLLTPLPEPPPPVTAAYVGRMLDDKGLRALIAAHRLMRAHGDNLELLLAGDPDPENPATITADELTAWNQEPGIHWLGHVKNIRDVWARAHIAVLPSRREGLPKSLLEAAACGRPMVASDAPGCREVAIEGETGLLHPIDDAPRLAEALLRLMGDAELRDRMGARARDLAVSRFSSADIGRQTVDLYRRLAG